MHALQTFWGPDGSFQSGQVFEVEAAERVKFLEDGGYAEKITKAQAKEIAQANPIPDPAGPGR
jgi:hypothetical protein